VETLGEAAGIVEVDQAGRLPGLTLRRLERDGLVGRTVYPTVPPRVDYELTDTGRSLTHLLRGLADWAAEHRDTVVASRARWDAAEQAR
jgi:DNA-binding HxlR family transcriptional regulator